LRQHSVDSLDSLNKIAQKYGVLVEDIIELNPNSSEKLTPGDNLIIPNPIHKKSVNEVKEVVSYKIHRVKKNETLYSISKKYGISIDDIKQNNKQLYDYPIKYKEKLYIPKYKTRALVPHTNLRLYSVKAKEGKWRIAHNFGITVKQLEALNPDLDSVWSTNKCTKYRIDI
jgi:LysM repeat protein